MGKAEGKGELWHGHVTAVTVAPEYRRLGKAKTLMNLLEDVTEKDYNAYFVDLFVRSVIIDIIYKASMTGFHSLTHSLQYSVSNTLAINMYRKFGYAVYRRVLGYYSGEEDAYGTCLHNVSMNGGCRVYNMSHFRT